MNSVSIKPISSNSVFSETHEFDNTTASPNSIQLNSINIDLTKLLSLITKLQQQLIARLSISNNLIANFTNSTNYDTPALNYLSQPTKIKSATPNPSITIMRSTLLPSNAKDTELKDNPFLYKAICNILLTDYEKERDHHANNKHHDKPVKIHYQEKHYTALKTSHIEHGFNTQEGSYSHPIRKTLVAASYQGEMTIIDEVDYGQIISANIASELHSQAS